MLYQRNPLFDFISTTENSLAVFDPESSDIHFFDETGLDILDILQQPCTFETLLDKLCQLYDACPDDIRTDVEDFLTDVTKKKVVIPYEN